MFPTVGISFKPEHLEAALQSPADGLWFEIHPENYMVAGGMRAAILAAISDARPISMHGVGLSLAGAESPDPSHLGRLRELVNRHEPFLVSEHLAWSRLGNTHFPDLLPFPRTAEALSRIVDNIDQVQEALGRAILIENPALYIHLDDHEWSETEFLAEVVSRAGCGLLIDVNNVYVSARNLGYDASAYLDALPFAAIGEIHVAGHRPDPVHGAELLIDSHDSPVAEPVWSLFSQLISRTGPLPTLIERDGNIPGFDELISERDRAASIIAASKVLVDA